VTARTSAFSFKGKDLKIAAIAGELGVEHVLEGSVRKAGHRIRVTAQLIRAANGFHVWSERFDRQLDDIFAIQDEIAARITEALQLQLAPARERHQPSMAAYEAYLKYRHYQFLFTQDSLRLSREHLERAIALDPKFALPLVGLANNHLVLSLVGAESGRDALRAARELTQRALDLDPELSDAHAMMGIVAGALDFDWREAEQRFEQAMNGDTVASWVRLWYATFFLAEFGRLEEARHQMELFLREDPLSSVGHQCMADVLQALGRDDEAIESYETSVRIEPGHYHARSRLSVLHSIRGEQMEALRQAEAALSLVPASPFALGAAAAALQMAGRTAEAETHLAKLLPGSAPVAPAGLFLYSVVCEDADRSVEWAEQFVVEQRIPALLWALVRPYQRRLRQSAKWPAFLEKINLPEASA